jgi:2-oxoglutarate ferredoxin oxidoreductase subunit alpha
MVTARRLAEQFRTVVIVLSDANLATGVQPFPRPALLEEWIAPEPDLSPVRGGQRPYDWDARLGLSTRVVPGQAGGMFTVTGLAHDENSKVAYSAGVHQRGATMRSRKLAVLQQMLVPPSVNGDEAGGDLLVVGWGSTKGAIEEAVQRARREGLSVSSVHLGFLSPLEPGLAAIFRRFRKVMTVEINYSDDPADPFITSENRRRGQLAFLLRAHTLEDVDCWTRVPGEPLRPAAIHAAIRSAVTAIVEADRAGKMELAGGIALVWIRCARWKMTSARGSSAITPVRRRAGVRGAATTRCSPPFRSCSWPNSSSRNRRCSCRGSAARAASPTTSRRTAFTASTAARFPSPRA